VVTRSRRVDSPGSPGSRPYSPAPRITVVGSPSGRSAEGHGFEGRGAEGRGPEGRGAEGRGAEGRGAEGRGAEGRGAEGRGAEGRGPEGRSRQGQPRSEDGGSPDTIRVTVPPRRGDPLRPPTIVDYAHGISRTGTPRRPSGSLNIFSFLFLFYLTMS